MEHLVCSSFISRIVSIDRVRVNIGHNASGAQGNAVCRLHLLLLHHHRRVGQMQCQTGSSSTAHFVLGHVFGLWVVLGHVQIPLQDAHKRLLELLIREGIAERIHWTVGIAQKVGEHVEMLVGARRIATETLDQC